MATKARPSIATRLKARLEDARFEARSALDLRLPLGGAELERARRIETVVLPLGPYRNLTTMTAALFALHPNAVVLNHAAARVFGSGFDPFAAPDDARWLRFKAGALRLATGGRGGREGGNILYSHAFGDSDLPAVYGARFGATILKPGARVLFWKDSMRLQNRFMADEAMFETFLGQRADVRFLFPIRNPMDCARSNLQRGHWRHLVPEAEARFDPVLRRILEALAWFRRREIADPARFLSFTEREIGPDLPGRIAAFAGLPADRAWAEEDAPRAVEIARRSEHPPEARAFYAHLVATLFADDAPMRARLEAFL